MWGHDKYIDELEKHSLEVDCPIIELTPIVENPNTPPFSGPGIIRNTNGSKSIEIKVFLTEIFVNWFDLSISMSREYVLYDLEALDLEGNKWLAKGVRIELTSHAIVRIVTHQITVTSEMKNDSEWEDKHQVGLVLEDAEEYIPPNERGREEWMEKTRRFPGLSVSGPGALLDIEGQLIQVIHHENRLLIGVFSEKPVSQLFTESLVQSAQFVCGHALNRVAYSYRDWEKREQSTNLQYYDFNLGSTNAKPPINQKLGHGDGECFWQLFELFLRHLLSHRAGGWEPIAQNIWSVIRSWDASIDGTGLITTIAIEGVLRYGFRSYGLADKDFKDAIKLATEAINSLEIDKRSKDRLVKGLNGWKGFSTKEALHRLKEEGLISAAQVSDWEATRNARAHAGGLDQKDISPLFHSNVRLLQLLYDLVFLKIGYTGKYTNYGEERWPERDFDRLLPSANGEEVGGNLAASGN